MIEDVVARARSEHRQATIELDVESAAHVIRSDAAAVRSAVQNLLANALKYGGTPAWARVRVGQTGAVPPELSVTVEDRGPGIDPRDVPHVFEAFYRGRLATEHRAPGNGLGLHIVKRSIEALGGRVCLHTQAGSGTAVTLHLPLSAAMDADDGEPTTPAAGR
jgi:signal transduction histidine kinase